MAATVIRSILPASKAGRMCLSRRVQGAPNYRESFLIAGASETGEPDAGQFGRARVFYPARDLKPLSVSQSELKRAVFLAEKLKSLDDKGHDIHQMIEIVWRASSSCCRAQPPVYRLRTGKFHGVVIDSSVPQRQQIKQVVLV
jgi:hypothetical protein